MLPLPFSFDKLLHHPFCLTVRELDEGMFHRIGRDGDEGASDSPIASDLTASNGIDGNAAAVG